MWVCECEYENEEEDTQCAACEEPRPAPPPADAEDDEFMNIVVGKVTACADAPNANLKLLKVDVSVGADLDIVTNASNVAVGANVVVAKVGAVVKGEEVKKAVVKGYPSHGMLCDCTMLGWTGGGAGAAVVLPDSFTPGARPPATRPRKQA